MMKVHITDEFNTTWSVSCESTEAVIKLVQTWLENRASTPIYEIIVEINDHGSEFA